MFMKRASTTAYIKVQMHQNETIHFFLFVQGFITSSKPMRNRGDISEKLWTARRKTETMLNTFLNQKISWINEEKRKKQYKQILDSSKDVAHWRFI